MIENEESVLQPIKRTPLLDSVTEALRHAILNGEIGPGERVNEITFTTKLQISRTTFREALRQLEQAGLLVRVPFRGMFVREFTKDAINDLNNLRGVLETYAAEIIIESGHHHPEDLLPLYEIVTEMEGLFSTEDASRTNDLHIGFHRTLLNLTGNKLLLSVWNDLAQQFWTAMLWVSQISFASEAEVVGFTSAHRKVVDAIASGDMTQVRQIIREHVAYSVESHNTERSPS